MTGIPTPEEVAAANAQAMEFLERVKAVPESERISVMSEKFSGPIGLVVVDDALTEVGGPAAGPGARQRVAR